MEFMGNISLSLGEAAEMREGFYSSGRCVCIPCENDIYGVYQSGRAEVKDYVARACVLLRCHQQINQEVLDVPRGLPL